MHRYIGITNEHLAKEGIELLKSKSYPKVDVVYCSPMLRCIETAVILYSKLEPVIINDLRECDFGDFENKNYKELSGNEDYQKWIDSMGTMDFPNGEPLSDFKKRCIKSFEYIIEDCVKNKYESIALIVHGGTIMSILDKYSYTHKDYYNCQIKSAEMIEGYIDEEKWIKGIKRIFC